MQRYSAGSDILKRKLRKLKKLEIRIRFGEGYIKGQVDDPRSRTLVWDDFFDLQNSSSKKARYSLKQLALMDKDRYSDVISEYFYHVYYRIYRENGILPAGIYDPELLGQLGLSFDADSNALKMRFRELAKKYHPDKGGDEASFIDMMEKYRKLCDG